MDYDLLDKFQVKSRRIEVLESDFRVFGNEINCYTLWSMEYTDDLIEKGGKTALFHLPPKRQNAFLKAWGMDVNLPVATAKSRR